MKRPAKPRVMVVDDNPTDLHLAKFAASKSGWIHELRTFDTGAEAIDFLSTQDEWWPHLIVTDLDMPEVSGLDILRFTKGDERFRSIPVVVLTSSRSEKDIKEAYRLYANSVVNKPTDVPQYVEVWRNLEQYWFDVTVNPMEH